MSDTGRSDWPVEAAVRPRLPQRRKRAAASWRSRLAIIGALGVGLAVGIGGLALAQSVQERGGWDHGPRLERIQQVVLRALDSVGATAAQEAKIHDIIAAGISDLAQKPGERGALRTQMLGLLRAPSLDRAAIEKLRADHVAAIDAMSKTVMQMVFDSADQLTAEQRAKLADRAQAMMQRGPMGGGWGGPHGGWMDDGRHHGTFRGDGPADEPERAPGGDGPGKG